MMTDRTPNDRSPVDLRSGNALLSDVRKSLPSQAGGALVAAIRNSVR
jgi:hypothetical protein